MTRARFCIPPQYIIAAQRRQRYLDYLSANPGALSSDISQHMREHFGDEHAPNNVIQNLLELREIERQPHGRHFKLFALTTATVTAEEMQKRRLAAVDASRNGRRVDGRDPEEPPRRTGPGYYRHEPGSIPGVGKGGQGAVRDRVFASGSGSWGSM